MKRMNWRRATLDSRPKLSLADEHEYRGRDAAARWLEANEAKRKPKKRKANKYKHAHPHS